MSAAQAPAVPPALSLPPVPLLRAGAATLRPLVPADAPSIARHADDPAVARNLYDGFPQPYTLAEAEAWCDAGRRSPRFGLVWAIEADGAAVGCLGLTPRVGTLACNAEIGYWIGRACWGRGLVAAALQTATAWAWTGLPQLTRIYAPIFARNPASQRVALKAGYVLEAHLPRSMLKAGEVIDVTQYAAYRPEPADRPR